MKSDFEYPFIFGAQYYRAPTPEQELWTTDLKRMRQLGFNHVKFWIQWRWSHRQEDEFIFDDVDTLLSLAEENNLKVTINAVFDIAPHWLYRKYPDALQVMNSGRQIEPYTVGHRQIGGHPGPCYNHPGALAERKKFFAAAITHFSQFPALQMWDVWNEPELSFPQRAPRLETLACYCPSCQAQFLEWLKRKYTCLDTLNQVWGRCYSNWDEVETPRNPQTITDFIDWREFHIDTMTSEAAWRLEMVQQLDPGRVHYLHVVPNVMSVFNSVTCAADDFQMAKKCDVFAATMNGGPILASQVVSAARGKACYNVESHINGGCTSMHQRILGDSDLLRDFLPQIGLGIRGFLFWQYRPEVLGFESPAWGLVGLDGSDRPITRSVQAFWAALEPHVKTILECPPSSAEIGIWKSRKNEIFHFCIHENFNSLIDSVEGYIQLLYGQSLPFRFIDDEMLANNELEGIKLLILPSPYCLSEAEASTLDKWVRAGGVVVAEAHLGGYNITTGRHSRKLPGCHLAQSWGFYEEDTTSSFHLKLDKAEAFQGAATEDVRKALADFGTSGGEHFPILITGSQSIAWGASRYARLAGENLTVEGCFNGDPVLVSKSVGKGMVFYWGSNLGQGSKIAKEGLAFLLQKAIQHSGVEKPLKIGSALDVIHLDTLVSSGGNLRYCMLLNRTDQPQEIHLQLTGRLKGIFTGTEWVLSGKSRLTIPGNFVDLLAYTQK